MRSPNRRVVPSASTSAGSPEPLRAILDSLGSSSTRVAQMQMREALAGEVRSQVGEFCHQAATELAPVLNYRWKNGFFAGTTYGLGYVFPSAEYLQYGVRLSADWGRKSNHSDVLAGMNDVDPALEAGGFLNVFFSRQVFITSTLRYGSGNDHRGLRLDLRAFYVNQFAPQWRFGAALATTAAKIGRAHV